MESFLVRLLPPPPQPLQSSHCPLTVTGTICAQPETGAFQAQLISGQISSNVSTEPPLIGPVFQTFDKREKGFQKDGVTLQLGGDVSGSLPLMFGEWGGAKAGGGSISAWQRSPAYLRYVGLEKKIKMTGSRVENRKWYQDVLGARVDLRQSVCVCVWGGNITAGPHMCVCVQSCSTQSQAAIFSWCLWPGCLAGT